MSLLAWHETQNKLVFVHVPGTQGGNCWCYCTIISQHRETHKTISEIVMHKSVFDMMKKKNQSYIMSHEMSFLDSPK